jgi:hypothetical protein
MELHRFFPVILVGQVLVVRPTHQADVVRAAVATETVRVPVVVLKAVAGGASSPLRVHEPAPPPVAAVHEALDGCRDVT